MKTGGEGNATLTRIAKFVASRITSCLCSVPTIRLLYVCIYAFICEYVCNIYIYTKLVAFRITSCLYSDPTIGLLYVCIYVFKCEYTCNIYMYAKLVASRITSCLCSVPILRLLYVRMCVYMWICMMTLYVRKVGCIQDD